MLEVIMYQYYYNTSIDQIYFVNWFWSYISDSLTYLWIQILTLYPVFSPGIGYSAYTLTPRYRASNTFSIFYIQFNLVTFVFWKWLNHFSSSLLNIISCYRITCISSMVNIQRNIRIGSTYEENFDRYWISRFWDLWLEHWYGNHNSYFPV